MTQQTTSKPPEPTLFAELDYATKELIRICQQHPADYHMIIIYADAEAPGRIANTFKYVLCHEHAEALDIAEREGGGDIYDITTAWFMCERSNNFCQQCYSNANCDARGVPRVVPLSQTPTITKRPPLIKDIT